MQLEHVEKHIAATTAPVMKEGEIKKLERIKALKDFLQSWWFAALIVAIGAPTMIVGQAHTRDKNDVRDMLSKPVIVNTASKG